ncbi:MAG TPA: hypothetical protein VMQ99_13820 [Acetobacteraceae bacterium]|nr:hypothetical protein [Acetobacteraceae bacterium]
MKLAPFEECSPLRHGGSLSVPAAPPARDIDLDGVQRLYDGPEDAEDQRAPAPGTNRPTHPNHDHALGSGNPEGRRLLVAQRPKPGTPVARHAALAGVDMPGTRQQLGTLGNVSEIAFSQVGDSISCSCWRPITRLHRVAGQVPAKPEEAAG